MATLECFHSRLDRDSSDRYDDADGDGWPETTEARCQLRDNLVTDMRDGARVVRRWGQ